MPFKLSNYFSFLLKQSKQSVQTISTDRHMIGVIKKNNNTYCLPIKIGIVCNDTLISLNLYKLNILKIRLFNNRHLNSVVVTLSMNLIQVIKGLQLMVEKLCRKTLVDVQLAKGQCAEVTLHKNSTLKKKKEIKH